MWCNRVEKATHQRRVEICSLFLRSLAYRSGADILNHVQMSIIKGNAGEIAFIAGVKGVSLASKCFYSVMNIYLFISTGSKRRSGQRGEDGQGSIRCS
jgi:hypothetical protein